MKTLSNTETELKKELLIKKRALSLSIKEVQFRVSEALGVFPGNFS